MPDVLLLGGYGMLARALQAAMRTRSIDFAAHDRDTCDITDGAAVESLVVRLRPRVIINAAAYTNVDGAEKEPQLANAINGQAVGHLAAAARKHNAKMVHYSTDFVFDGRATSPYHPDHPPAPLSAYGLSKLLGEQQLAQVDPPGWLLIRTAWLYGSGGRNFPRTIVERARAGGVLKVVNDQLGAPTLTTDLADATLDLLKQQAAGIYHFTNSGTCSWHDFAVAACECFGCPADVQPISSADWDKLRPGAARRPAYSVLDLSRFAATVGRPLRPWREALAAWRGQVEADGSF